MNEKEKALACQLLKDYANILGNNGCNDWEFPVDWTSEEQLEFVREFYVWNGDPENFDPQHLRLPDFAVADFLAYRLG